MTSQEILVKMIFDRWQSLLNICDDHLNTISDEQLTNEISPGKNRGIYILGHLVAVHDAMLPILQLGQSEYPELYTIFVKSPDKTIGTIPAAHELRTIWKKQLITLSTKLNSIPLAEWFEKHQSVSAEDFEKEPHRNKLNILLTRTTHLAYHAGQLVLIK